MSQRPLDQIKRETKAANRAHHLRKKSQPPPDQIDALDNIGVGGAYHHDGPYDATLAARNRNVKYAPVDAVRESNAEALKATPYDNLQDSLRKHVPLQGTANIPPGGTDISGRRLDYEEGADLMRDLDAPGGAYKRYDGIKYHPGDLKGKGEPSYTLEEHEKAKKRAVQRSSSGTSGEVYEMRPTAAVNTAKDGTTVRQRMVAK